MYTAIPLDVDFEWDDDKNESNVDKHHVSFEIAKLAWLDPWRSIIEDRRHSTSRERRYLMLGKVAGRVLTVYYTMRGENVRIIGAGYFRKGAEKYEQGNSFRR